MDGRPLLAVVYSPRSKPWSEIAEAAADLCRLLWIADESELGTTARVLRKLGKVIDTAGYTDEQLVAIVKAERPDGITSYFDHDLPRQAALAAALGLTGPSADVVTLLNDKLLQRQALECAGVPIPRFAAVGDCVDDAEIDRLCEALPFPMLLKPRDGTASRGILPIGNKRDLVTALKNVERPSDLILEERLADTSHVDWCADLVCVETIVSRGTLNHLGVIGFFPMAPPLRLTGLFYPANVERSDITELFGLATASIHAMGAGASGWFRTEIKRTPDGWKIIEINGRPSGSTPALMKVASGMPILQLNMRHALGEDVLIEDEIPCERIAYRYICEPPTKAVSVGAISRLNRLREHAGVLEIDTFKESGDPVDWRNGSLDRVFQVTGTVSDYDELAEHYRACSTDSFVTYEYQPENSPSE